MPNISQIEQKIERTSNSPCRIGLNSKRVFSYKRSRGKSYESNAIKVNTLAVHIIKYYLSSTVNIKQSLTSEILLNRNTFTAL